MIKLNGNDLGKTTIPSNYFWVDTTNYNYEEKVYLYETLTKNCKELGMEDSAKDWDIELKKIISTINIQQQDFFLFIFKNTGGTLDMKEIKFSEILDLLGELAS